MINVIVVPETEGFKMDVSHENVVWISRNLGVPRLKDRNAKYLAPFWLTEKINGVNRLYHIEDVYVYDAVTEIYLGNSFVVSVWSNMGQHRRYEYHNLDVFGVTELQSGILV